MMRDSFGYDKLVMGFTALLPTYNSNLTASHISHVLCLHIAWGMYTQRSESNVQISALQDF
jgi:hypothetical protein